MKVEYKGYYIKPNKSSPTSVEVSTAGIGGTVPVILGGLFTSTALAKREIDRYLEGKVNDKASGEGRVQQLRKGTSN